MSQERAHTPSAEGKSVGEPLFPAKSVDPRLAAFAKDHLPSGALVVPAKENGNYKGTVVAANEHFVVQAVGYESRMAVAHRKSDLQMQGSALVERSKREMLVGAEMQVIYNGATAKVYPYSRVKEMDASLGHDVAERLSAKVEKNAEGRWSIASDKLSALDSSLANHYNRPGALASLGKSVREIGGDATHKLRPQFQPETLKVIDEAARTDQERRRVPEPKDRSSNHATRDKATPTAARPAGLSAEKIMDQATKYAAENIKNVKQREAFLKHLSAVTEQTKAPPEASKTAKAEPAKAKAAADHAIER